MSDTRPERARPAEPAITPHDTVDAAVALVREIESYNCRKRLGGRGPLKHITARRHQYLRRRVLIRTLDYLEEIIRMLRSGRNPPGMTSHLSVYEHVYGLLGQPFHKIDFEVIRETKNRLKIDAIEIAKDTCSDWYIYDRLCYEQELIAKRDELTGVEEAIETDVNIPSEELNTGWDLFLPEGQLD